MSARLKMMLGLASLLAALGLVWYSLPVVHLVALFREWILDLGLLGIFAFIVFYIGIALFIGPVLALAITAGFTYGIWGFPLVVLSAVAAASVTLLISRYLARDRVSRLIQSNRNLKALNIAVCRNDWKVMTLVRLSPVLPFGLQNYLISVTDVGFLPYVFAAFIGILPSSALYVYIGTLGNVSGKGGMLTWALIAVGLIATVLVVWLIARSAQAALESMDID